MQHRVKFFLATASIAFAGVCCIVLRTNLFRSPEERIKSQIPPLGEQHAERPSKPAPPPPLATAQTILGKVSAEGADPERLLLAIESTDIRNRVIDEIVNELGFDAGALAQWFGRIPESNELERHVDQLLDNMRGKLQSPRRELEMLSAILKAMPAERSADPARSKLLGEFIKRGIALDRRKSKADFLALRPAEQELCGAGMLASLVRISPNEAAELYSQMQFTSEASELETGASLASAYLAAEPFAATEWVGRLDAGPIKSQMIPRVALWWAMNGAKDSISVADSFTDVNDRRQYLAALKSATGPRDPALAEEIGKALASLK